MLAEGQSIQNTFIGHIVNSKPRDKNRFRRWLSTTALVLCLGLIGWHFVQNPGSLAPLGHIQMWHLVVMLGLHLAILATNTIRFRLVLEKCALQAIPLKPWISLFVNGRFLNLFVPQAGNVYRSVELKRRYDVPHTRYVTTLVAVAWLSTALNLALASILIAVLNPTFQLGPWPAWAVVLMLWFSIVVGPFAARAVLRPIRSAPGRWGWAQRRIGEVLDVATQSARDRVWLSRVMGLSLVVFILATTNVALCFTALGRSALIGESALFYSVLQVSNIVKVTPGNLGAQELAFGALGAHATVGMSEGILASALFRAGAMVILGAVALPLGARQLLSQKAESAENERV